MLWASLVLCSSETELEYEASRRARSLRFFVVINGCFSLAALKLTPQAIFSSWPRAWPLGSTPKDRPSALSKQRTKVSSAASYSPIAATRSARTFSLSSSSLFTEAKRTPVAMSLDLRTFSSASYDVELPGLSSGGSGLSLSERPT